MTISKIKQFFLTNLAILGMTAHLSASDIAIDELKRPTSKAQNDNPNAPNPDSVLVRYTVHSWEILEDGNVRALVNGSAKLHH